MATIHYVGKGKAPYVQLSDQDKERLASAVAEYREQGGSMTLLAKELGLNRTHLHALFSVQRIELMRFASMQTALKVQILDSSEVDLFIASIRSLLFVG